MKYLVGLEAEFLYYENGSVDFPPYITPKDDFEIFGEVRGEPASNVPEVIANFWKEYHLIQENLRVYGREHAKEISTWKTEFVFRHLLSRDLYKKAIKKMGSNKIEAQEKILNVYGTDLTDHSDLLVKAGKITGAYISCGLHIHFSAHSGATYKKAPSEISSKHNQHVYIIDPEGRGTSVLTAPAIGLITAEMDKAFFSKYSMPENERTKYRNAGYIELKPYGFEYRSLPATDTTIADLHVIVAKAFELLKMATKWHAE